MSDQFDELRNLFGPKIGDGLVEGLHIVGDAKPALVAALDQAWKASRDARAEAPQAAQERRCVSPPIGCGQPLGKPLSVAFRDAASRREYDITGTCQSCQDILFAPDTDEIAEMAADTENYGRCGECGEYRPYEFVDVGVGVIKGFDCCRSEGPSLPRCTKIQNCSLGADHMHDCDPYKRRS